uniref:Predicted protein n=1 Tax=Hordeum vulgare subsp. vulgare TaxID=112509 RepID=F2DB95_HORVV|nr:predicted protein [Hordeum vulgare subsp. vulgare]
MELLHHSIQLSAGPGSAAAPTPTQPPSDGGTMSSELYLALCRGRKKEAMALLRQQHGGTAAAAANQVAGIHQVSAEGNSVLHLAAEHGHDKLIHDLASLGGRSLLSSRNSTLDTPLHCAARAGHGKAVSLLVQLSCEGGDESTLWCRNEAGNTALHLAARLGHAAAVEAMVSAAPGLASEVNNAGVSALYLAVMSRSVPAARSITTRCPNASAAGLSSQNALHAAVFQGSEMVRLLLEWTPPCGSSLASQADGNGSTPLHFASSTGDGLSVVGAILRAVPPCVVRMRDSGGLSALHVAAGMGHERVAEALIKACPDAAELRDDRGGSGTFLHAAARGGHLKVVRLAMRKRTLRGLLNAQDGDGNTPLHLAVAAGAPAVAEALMRKGKVRDDIMNNDGQTPLDLAVRSTSFFSMVSVVATLAAFGAQSRPERRDRVQQWDSHEITKAIEKTSDSLAVIAVLVASVAFTAANNLPGSYEQSTGGPDGTEVIKGMAVLQHENIFKCFLILDSFALVTSVLAVVLLLYGKASRSAGSWKTFAAALHCLWLSLVSMVLAFYAALAAVTSTTAVRSIAYWLTQNALFALLAVVSHLVSPKVSSRTLFKYMWRCGSRGRHSVVVQQYPLVGAFVRNLMLFRVANYVAVVVGLTTVSGLGG